MIASGDVGYGLQRLQIENGDGRGGTVADEAAAERGSDRDAMNSGRIHNSANDCSRVHVKHFHLRFV
jgi:hypothetical protein